MSDPGCFADLPADEMEDFLRLFVDETAEQLDGLVQAILALKDDPSDIRQLDEAFRLLHSIKGASALLGLGRITTLTDQLDIHFVRLRSGKDTLDATVNAVLGCVDCVRDCNERLRRGEPLAVAGAPPNQV